VATCTSIIRRIFSSYPRSSLVCSRELVRHCQREAMDQAIFRMVKRGEIVRITSGVFVRSDSDRFDFSDLEVARAKARAYGKQLCAHGARLAQEFTDVVALATDHILGINRDTTAFKISGRVVQLKRTSGRCEKLSDDKIGQAIKVLWAVGKDRIERELVKKVTEGYTKEEFADLFSRSGLMPYWLLSAIREGTGRMWKICSVEKLFDMAKPAMLIKTPGWRPPE
jgi:hypothetical protein